MNVIGQELVDAALHTREVVLLKELLAAAKAERDQLRDVYEAAMNDVRAAEAELDQLRDALIEIEGDSDDIDARAHAHAALAQLSRRKSETLPELAKRIRGGGGTDEDYWP